MALPFDGCVTSDRFHDLLCYLARAFPLFSTALRFQLEERKKPPELAELSYTDREPVCGTSLSSAKQIESQCVGRLTIGC